MFTKTALSNLLFSFWSDLNKNGFQPEKLILFGSYAKGEVHRYSDVDVTVWSPGFSGEFHDFEKALPVLRNYPKIQAKLYPSFADEANFNPFIEEIKRTGVVIYEQEKRER
jgi:predicted nucleotidyltransferase